MNKTYVVIILILCYIIWNMNIDLRYNKSEIKSYQNTIEELKFDKILLKDEIIILNTILYAYQIQNSYNVELTAYTARPQETNSDPGNTAIMERPIPGWTIAVSQDLKHLLGKRVYIPGFGVRRVNDLMNVRYSKRIDILVGCVSYARQIGLQETEMILIEPQLLFQKTFNVGELYAHN